MRPYAPEKKAQAPNTSATGLKYFNPNGSLTNLDDLRDTLAKLE